ncbi:hypothetical protein IPJ72_05250 [Candidatus Peregrinibacteria bacterium]|nr:MAG: hypothetical protein IPJ72_05250 [Candidatus Peregrinibacteria bacterium]
MQKKTHRPQGFIAIVSLLIVTTVAMFFAMGMLLDGVNNASLSLNSIYYENARLNVSTCFEDVMWRLKQEYQFPGNLNYQIGPDDTCTSTMQWFSPQQIAPGIQERLATLDIHGVSNGFNRTFQYQLRIETYDVNFANYSGVNHYNTIDILSINEL